MLSKKGLPWELIHQKSLPQFYSPGLKFFYSSNETCITLVKDYLKKACKVPLRFLAGAELSLDHLDEMTSNLSLFPVEQQFFVFEGEKISTKVRDLIAEKDWSSAQYPLFIFSFKKDIFAKKKFNSLDHFRIDPPPFWENQRAVKFLSDYFGLTIGFKETETLLQLFPNDFDSLYSVFQRLQAFGGQEGGISVETIKGLEGGRALQTFEVADLLGDKKIGKFWEKLVSAEENISELRSLIPFLQGHLAKLADPSYIDEKKRPTQYDKRILKQSQMWKKEEILNWMGKLDSLEVDLKASAEEASKKIRLHYLESLSQ